MDAKARLLVMATAQKHIHLVDLHNPTSIYRTAQSPLKCQTKSVAAFPDGTGWATVSIEGRCGIEPVIEEQPRYYSNYSTKQDHQSLTDWPFSPQ